MKPKGEPIKITFYVHPDGFPLLQGGYVDVRDAARYLGVARQTVRSAIARGLLSAEQHTSTGAAGFRWMIPTEDLNRYKGSLL